MLGDLFCGTFMDKGYPPLPVDCTCEKKCSSHIFMLGISCVACPRVTLESTVSCLTLPMLRLLSSKAQGCNDFWKPSKPCHVGILIGELSLKPLRWVPMCQVFGHFSGFLHHFVFGRISHQQHKGKEILQKLLSWSMLILKITWESGIVLRTTSIWRRVPISVDISPSDIFWNVLWTERFRRNRESTCGCWKH